MLYLFYFGLAVLFGPLAICIISFGIYEWIQSALLNIAESEYDALAFQIWITIAVLCIFIGGGTMIARWIIAREGW